MCIFRFFLVSSIAIILCLPKSIIEIEYRSKYFVLRTLIKMLISCILPTQFGYSWLKSFNVIYFVWANSSRVLSVPFVYVCVCMCGGGNTGKNHLVTAVTT